MSNLHWFPAYWLYLFCLLAAWVFFAWSKISWGNAKNVKQGWGVYMSLALVALVGSSPLHHAGREYLFLARMFETLILLYVLPALTLRSVPNILWLTLWQNPFRRKILFPFLDITWSTVGFNILFFVWHLPAVYNLGLRYDILDQMHVFGIWALGFLMWLPLNVRYQPMRLNMPRQMFYLVTLILGQVPLFALLTFTREPLYGVYATAARITPLNALADQQLSGWTLKVVSSLIFASAFIAIFLEWSRRQRKQDAEDNALAFENFELVKRASRRSG